MTRLTATWSLSVAYLPRVVDGELRARLAAVGAVVIEGPKACGKTETARQQVASAVLLDVDENARRAAAPSTPCWRRTASIAAQ